LTISATRTSPSRRTGSTVKVEKSAKGKKQHTTDQEPPSSLLLALEGRALLEWTACAAAWPLLSHAPRGDGHPVLVLPGLAAGDASTWPLRKFLEGRGYVVYPWDQGLNLGPRDGVVRKLVARLRKIFRDHHRKVSVIGWSLGGAMARVLAAHEPDHVRSVITLGAPLGGNPKATNAWRLFEFVSGQRADDPHLKELLSKRVSVPNTSIYSKTDGIVAWPISQVFDGDESENIEVGASHFGMGANPAVLYAVADRLALREDKWKPFDCGGWRSLFFSKPA
jgi:pimeloyl-ACP methyl ester carboxylesterase